MANATSYSYTERKRIRKSFGTRDEVLAIPYLLQMQKDAYTVFLQAGIPPQKRIDEGLQLLLQLLSRSSLTMVL
jgi:DNA-directed RNA polymerase subunit beta